MHPHVIQSMVEALQPVLKNKSKAGKILERFWQDKIALVWDAEDVHCAANEIEIALTEEEACEVLRYLLEHHDPQYGLRWNDLTQRIRDAVLGRAMTRREVNRFVHRDILTIQCPR